MNKLLVDILFKPYNSINHNLWQASLYFSDQQFGILVKPLSIADVIMCYTGTQNYTGFTSILCS